MNSHAFSRTRLTCRLVRIWSSSDAPTSGWGARHVAGCPDCQNYFAAAGELDLQLMQQARRATPAMPAGLEQRLFAAIEPTLAHRRSRPVRPRGLVFAASGAVAVAAMVLGVWQLRGPQPVGDTEVVQQQGNGAEAVEPDARALAIFSRLPDNLWSAVGPRAETLTEDNPLQRELAAMQADTRSALRFLAKNFLPTESTLFGADEETTRSSS